MKNNKLIICLTAFAIGFAQIACNDSVKAPVRSKPTPSNIALTITEIPTILPKGETGVFSTKTEATASCFAAIGYMNASGKWTWIDLPELVADEAGSCKWSWTVPLYSSAGIAEFCTAVRRQDEFESLIPQTFCIEKRP